MRRWSEKTEIRVGRFMPWVGIGASKFYNWRQRYGRVNEHNGWIPRDFWLEDWEKAAIIKFHGEHRRLSLHFPLSQDSLGIGPPALSSRTFVPYGAIIGLGT